ncbi:MAG: CTP synthase, partial [Chloroflexi bacterium]|nr:CTP synthase [Chloroflexota bacterium]
VFQSERPHSTEFDPETPYPVIDLMPGQKEIDGMGGTMRLGNYPCELAPETVASRAYGVTSITERHRHRFEFNNEFREPLANAGLGLSGISPDGKLVEIVEFTDHPFMLGTQFHPEFLSRPDRPHPLFKAFVGVAKEVLREGGQHPLPIA